MGTHTVTSFAPRHRNKVHPMDAEAKALQHTEMAEDLKHSNGNGMVAPGVVCRSLREESPAYTVLEGLLESKYRVGGEDELDLIYGTSSRCYNLMVLPLACCTASFEVASGHIRLADDGSGNSLLFGSGVHFVCDMFVKVQREDVPLTQKLILWGDRTIVTVKQGHIGYAEDMGQPVLLPPGLHEWKSSTLKFHHHVDLNNTMIKLGPFTVMTVDEGYSAITQNNGTQVVLPGGNTHLLNHRNWKFEKFMTEKIQTDKLERIEATSADNVMMHTDATVVWRVTDVQSAAKISAETMQRDGSDVANAADSDIRKLRTDVLMQATASLAAFIGEIRYSDSFHVSAAANALETTGLEPRETKSPMPADLVGYSPIFDTQRMCSAVETANAITSSYGVNIISINIIAANPADKNLQIALAKGAVASAEAEQAETVARGEAKAAQIRADGDATAEKIRADGARAAADKLSESAVAVQLATITKTGEALDKKTSFFFGADPQNIGGVLCNPALVSGMQAK